MIPHTALRRLEKLVRDAGYDDEQALEAEECLSVLWEYVLKGRVSDRNAGVCGKGNSG